MVKESMTIGEALKEERKNLGLRQKEMAQGILSVSEYSKIENNVHSLDANTLFKLLATHQIDISDFYKKVYATEDIYNINYLAKDLEKAFYKSNIKRVQKIKILFDKLANVPLELKLRTRLTLAVLKQDYSSIDEKSKQAIFKNMFNQDNWVKNQNSLKLFGNSMFLWDFKDISLMIDAIFNEYEEIENYPDDIQERIAQICVNYLYNGIKYVKSKQIIRAINILHRLDVMPHLIAYKIIGLYFQYYYDGQSKKEKEIKELLIKSGCEDLVEKFPK